MTIGGSIFDWTFFCFFDLCERWAARIEYCAIGRGSLWKAADVTRFDMFRLGFSF